MQPLNCIGSVAGFLSALAEEIGHDREVFITTVWQSEKPGSEAWMADVHVRVPKHDPNWLDAEYGLADYAEAGGVLVKKFDKPMPLLSAHVNRDISMDDETGAALDDIIATAARRLVRTPDR